MTPEIEVLKDEVQESAVLASILMENSLLEQVADRLSPEEFSSRRCSLIYRAMLDLQAGGLAPDTLLLQGHLAKVGQLKEAGDMEFILALDAIFPDPSRIDLYVNNVKDLAARRRMALLFSSGLRDIVSGKNGDGLSIAARYRQQLLDEELAHHEGDWKTAAEVCEAADQVLETGGMPGISTGYPAVDRVTGGMKQGNLIILAGRPGMGKTALALNMAHRQAQAGVWALLFSMEMITEEIGLRLLSLESGLPYSALERGGYNNLTKVEIQRVHEAQQRLRNLPLLLDDRGTLTIEALASTARKAKKRGQLGAIYCDYGQLMSRQPGTKHESDNSFYEHVSKSSKVLAKDLKVPFCMLCQLNRDVEKRADKRPTLADLRGSGGWEQDADMVVFPYRPEYYNRMDRPGEVEIIIAKNRNGAVGLVEPALRFRAPNMMFE